MLKPTKRLTANLIPGNLLNPRQLGSCIYVSDSCRSVTDIPLSSHALAGMETPTADSQTPDILSRKVSQVLPNPSKISLALPLLALTIPRAPKQGRDALGTDAGALDLEGRTSDMTLLAVTNAGGVLSTCTERDRDHPTEQILPLLLPTNQLKAS